MRFFNKSSLDILLVLYAIIGFSLPFLISTLNPLFWLILTPFQIVFIVVVMNTSMHHHTHVPIFKSTKLNRMYEIFVSMTTSIPFQLWKYLHLTHHRFNNDKKKDGVVKDPLSFYRYGKDNERENFWSYVVLGLYRDFSGESSRDTLETCSTKFNLKEIDKLKIEKMFIMLYFLSILVVSWTYFIYYVLVVLLTLFANNANSYGEHYLATDHANFRCDSIGSYGKLFNFLCFNSGYHQEHHVKPSLHWTRLPELTHTLPDSRKTINGLYIFNAPLVDDFKLLFRKNK